MVRRDFLRSTLYGLLGAVCAPLSGKGEAGKAKNVWWESCADYHDQMRGVGSSGYLRLWKEGVPGHVYVGNQYRPEWATPEVLADVLSKHDGTTEFVRIYGPGQCYDFYCVPTMDDELTRGSLIPSPWEQPRGPSKGQ